MVSGGASDASVSLGASIGWNVRNGRRAFHSTKRTFFDNGGGSKGAALTKQVEIRLPLWSAVVIAATLAVGVTYLATSLAMANRNNELLRENVRLRNELADQRERLHRIEVGIVNVYRVSLLDLMRRIGIDGREGEGSVFSTMVRAVDAIDGELSNGIGGVDDYVLPEMQGGANPEDLDSD